MYLHKEQNVWKQIYILYVLVPKKFDLLKRALLSKFLKCEDFQRERHLCKSRMQGER